MSTPEDAQRVRLEGAYQSGDTRVRISADLAVLWIKSLLIVNGGAIIGLTALVGTGEPSTIQKFHLAWALSGFAASVVLTLTALMIGYVGQATMTEADGKLAESHFTDMVAGATPRGVLRSTAASWVSGVALASTSLTALVVGLWQAILAVVA